MSRTGNADGPAATDTTDTTGCGRLVGRLETVTSLEAADVRTARDFGGAGRRRAGPGDVTSDGADLPLETMAGLPTRPEAVDETAGEAVEEPGDEPAHGLSSATAGVGTTDSGVGLPGSISGVGVTAGAGGGTVIGAGVSATVAGGGTTARGGRRVAGSM